MESKKISVIIVCYNHEKFIDRTLESVFNQTIIDDCQIIIGDDGSSDRTVEKIEQWQSKNKNIECYVRERDNNVGNFASFRVSQNRLFLVSKVKTPYFVLLDGDDYWTDTRKLYKQYQILENPNNVDCVACGHNITEKNENDSSSKLVTNIFEEKKLDVEEYYTNHYIHTDTLLIRSEILKRIDTYFLEKSFDDNIITYSVLQYGKLYYLPESMGVYVKHKNGIWTSSTKIQQILLSVIDYDISLLINKKLKKVCKQRFGWYITEFLSDTIELKEINNQLLDFVYKKNLRTCKKLLNNKCKIKNRVINNWRVRLFY